MKSEKELTLFLNLTWPVWFSIAPQYPQSAKNQMWRYPCPLLETHYCLTFSLVGPGLTFCFHLWAHTRAFAACPTDRCCATCWDKHLTCMFFVFIVSLSMLRLYLSLHLPLAHLGLLVEQQFLLEVPCIILSARSTAMTAVGGIAAEVLTQIIVMVVPKFADITKHKYKQKCSSCRE